MDMRLLTLEPGVEGNVACISHPGSNCSVLYQNSVSPGCWVACLSRWDQAPGRQVVSCGTGTSPVTEWSICVLGRRVHELFGALLLSMWRLWVLWSICPGYEPSEVFGGCWPTVWGSEMFGSHCHRMWGHWDICVSLSQAVNSLGCLGVCVWECEVSRLYLRLWGLWTLWGSTSQRVTSHTS